MCLCGFKSVKYIIRWRSRFESYVAIFDYVNPVKNFVFFVKLRAFMLLSIHTVFFVSSVPLWLIFANTSRQNLNALYALIWLKIRQYDDS